MSCAVGIIVGNMGLKITKTKESIDGLGLIAVFSKIFISPSRMGVVARCGVGEIDFISLN
jgi:hypothetical protein